MLNWMRSSRGVRHGAWCTCVLLVLTVLSAPAARAGPLSDVCGFGIDHPMRFEPAGGGDRIVWTKNVRTSYIDIFDSASPVTLENHDNLIIVDTAPSEVTIKRNGDDLAVCATETRMTIIFEAFYCRATALSGTDTNNHEIEEIRFTKTGDLWLSDVLMESYRSTPGALDLALADETPPQPAVAEWRVRPFSEVLPDYASPARSCP